MVGDGHAGSQIVEDPVVGAFQTFLVLPVPGTAAEVRRSSSVGGGLGALTVGEVVSVVAGSTKTSSSPDLALVRDWDALLHKVEVETMGALQTDIALGVPGTAAKVRRLSNSRSRANSFGQGVSAVTRQTGSISGIPGLALVCNGSADSEGVEIGARGAFGANASVPQATEGVAGAVQRRSVDVAGSVGEDVSVVAGEAMTLVVPGAALVGDGSADSFIHEPSL